MRKPLLIVATFVVLVGLCFYLVASVANSQVQADQGPGRERVKSGPSLLMRYVRGNMVAQTIAGITKDPVDTIRKKLEEQHLPAVLAEYNVDRKAFAEGMHTRFQALLGQLSNDGYLTIDQKNLVLTQMDQNAQRRTLMKGLIDKAVKDGTITPDQAQMLLKRPR
jgi:hypothetical protein